MNLTLRLRIMLWVIAAAAAMLGLDYKVGEGETKSQNP